MAPAFHAGLKNSKKGLSSAFIIDNKVRVNYASTKLDPHSTALNRPDRVDLTWKP